MAVSGSPGSGSSVYGGGAWSSLRDVGELDIHGAPRKMSWAKVQYTVDAGSSRVVVEGSVDFETGDVLVLSSPPEEVVVHSVLLEIDGDSVILLKRPTRFKHASSVDEVGGEVMDLRVEVGLLSRNVVIQGDPSSLTSTFGGHTIAKAGGEYRIENAELRFLGQAGYGGRHPIHFSGLGAVSPGSSYARKNSVHHSWNRGIVLGGTAFAEVTENVAYFVEGHTFHVADDQSTHNVFANNLGVLTRKTLGCGKSDCKAATFSVFEPKNYWRYNAATDSMNNAFGWTMPCGSPATKEPVLELYANSAHNAKKNGINTGCK